MNIEVLEKEKGKIKLEVKGIGNTFPQLIADSVWEEGAQGAMIREHPFMEEPKVIVTGSNPKKALENAAIKIEEFCDEFQEEFKRALKK